MKICITTQKLNNLLTEQFLIENRINKRIPIYKLAKELHCSRNTIIKYLKKFNIPRDYLGYILTEKYLKEYYVNKELSSPEIGKLVNCDASTVRDYLKKYGIKIRNSGAYLKGKKGNKARSWKGGTTPLQVFIRNLPEYKTWVIKVFQRDNYVCQECGKKGRLEAHHIKEFSKLLQKFLQEYSQFSPLEDKETLTRLAISYAPFWDISNGKSLCPGCHELTYKKSKGRK